MPENEIVPVPLEIALDGKIHVFFFTGTKKADIRFARIEDLDKVYPGDQLYAAIYELTKERKIIESNSSATAPG
jgi:hypothetical protein